MTEKKQPVGAKWTWSETKLFFLANLRQIHVMWSQSIWKSVWQSWVHFGRPTENHRTAKCRRR